MKVLRNLLGVTIFGILWACSFHYEAKLSFSFSAEPINTNYNDTLLITFSDGRETRSVSTGSFLNLPYSHQTKKFYTDNDGSLKVRFRIFTESNDSIAFGKIKLDLKPDWSWNIRFHRGETNPFNACFGCQGYQSFPLDTVYRQSGSDSVFVIWGGNSISNPVVY
ncbi:MAG: hypothetical protein MAGBODY4_00577 [Candidatus Marinimicrobia bacterium]|nr:hypothetical protein [Candidatus Neomarinimicrobiota bacterium]